MSSLFTFVLVVVTGFICAGFMNSVYQVVTNKAASFDLSQETSLGLLTGLLVLIFAGPFVIMRYSVLSFIAKNSRGSWVAASTAISVFWSFVSGLFLLNIYLTMF